MVADMKTIDFCLTSYTYEYIAICGESAVRYIGSKSCGLNSVIRLVRLISHGKYYIIDIEAARVFLQS